MSEPLRVLRVLTRPNVGGPTRQVVELWHAHRAMGVRTLLAVGRCECGEVAVDLSRVGVPRLAPAEVVRAGPAAEGLVVVDDLRRGLRPFGDLGATRSLRALIRAFDPHVVHTHTSKAGWLGRRAAVEEGVPVVAHTFHGHVLRDYFRWPLAALLRAAERRLAARTDLLFAVSASCRDELAALHIGAGRMQITPPAVDLAPFAAAERDAARAALGARDGRPLVGFVGRLVPIKRPDVFAAAMARLPEADGLAFGDGPLRAQLQRDHRGVCWLGATSELASRLAGLDVLVLSSEREGCPLAALEAFAAGVAVVGFDVPGVRDVLADWGAGVLVPRRDGAVGLARAVREVLVDRDARAALVARARVGLERHRPERVARLLAEAYRAASPPLVLQGGPRRRRRAARATA